MAQEAQGYNEEIAEIYDSLFPSVSADSIDLLAELAAGGRVLELGIGTGRIALPLHLRGVDVHGVDASRPMVARLHAKPHGDRIPVTIGNFAEAEPAGPFSLVYVCLQTFFVLLTQEEQVACLCNVAARLQPGGRFLIEAFVPDPTRFSRGQGLYVLGMTDKVVHLEASMHDYVSQRVNTNHVLLTADGVRIVPSELRYATIAELDLMARIAGLELEHRWSDWQRTPFASTAPAHISVYRRP